MTRLFRRLSPRVQAWVLDHGWLVVMAVVFLIGAAGVVFFTRPDPVTATDHVIAKVLSAFDTSDEYGFSRRFVVELPDASRLQVKADSLVSTGHVTDHVCLEQRTHDSGRVSFRILRPEICDTAAD